jgi:predicted dehydrogenase
MVNPVGIGIIGCGYWGLNYIRVLVELPQSAVLVASDQQTDRLDLVKKRFPTVRTDPKWESVLENGDIEALVISTPATTHHALARECLLHGKHVMIEKPMTTDVEGAEELVALADDRQLVTMVGHTFLYNTGIKKMKTCIESDEFGKVYYLHGTRTNMGPIRQDVNAIWDLAPHDVSIFNYLVGKQPNWVSAVGGRVLGNTREDVGFITLHYPSNIVGNVHVSWADPSKVRKVVVVGSNRRMAFDDMNATEQVRIFEKGVASEGVDHDSFAEYRLLMKDGDIISPKIESSEPLKNQCCHFLECIRNGTRPLTDSRNGLDVVKIMVAIQESVARNGAPVKLG